MRRIALACALFGLVTTGAVDAQTTAVFTDPSVFSGNESLVGFDASGYGTAAEVPDAEGIELDLGNGRWPRFLLNGIAREFGPSDVGSINNFFLVPRPYPDLGMRFPEPVERVGFEAIVNSLDDLTVTLLFEGAVVDEVVFPSRGVELFYFYGVESDTSFDEVRLTAGDVLGSLSVDNVRFESVGAATPLQLSCDRIEPAMSRWFREFRNSRQRRVDRNLQSWRDVFQKLRRSRTQRILTADLKGAEGEPLLPDEVVAPPRILVTHKTDPAAEPVDVTASLMDAASPELNYVENLGWSVAISRHAMRSRGSYEISVESGDESEYSIDPTCQLTVGHFGWQRRRLH